MKITSKILSIPPYLSTTWKNISSLHVREEGGFFRLIVLLQNRVQVEVPNLDKATVDAIFEAHARSAELDNPPSKNPLDGGFSFSLPLKSEGGAPLLDSFTAPLLHNPEQAQLPPLPPEILKKIASVTNAFVEDLSVLPRAEPNCNCPYCQVIRAVHGEPSSPPKEEEPVSEEDLKFRNWDISQTGEKLYLVTNPLDQNEHYNVYLGEPLGCTCGEKNCEHICAVLNT